MTRRLCTDPEVEISWGDGSYPGTLYCDWSSLTIRPKSRQSLMKSSFTTIICCCHSPQTQFFSFFFLRDSGSGYILRGNYRNSLLLKILKHIPIPQPGIYNDMRNVYQSISHHVSSTKDNVTIKVNILSLTIYILFSLHSFKQNPPCSSVFCTLNFLAGFFKSFGTKSIPR